MLTLGSKAKYGDHDCIVVGRTIEAHSRYDVLFPASRRIEQNVPEKDLEPCSIAPSICNAWITVATTMIAATPLWISRQTEWRSPSRRRPAHRAGRSTAMPAKSSGCPQRRMGTRARTLSLNFWDA